MKWIAIVVAAGALAVGAGHMKSSGIVAPPTPNDNYAWQESSGPKGERDSRALPLYRAITERDVGEVRRLLDSGSSPNQVLAPTGWSPVEMAIYFDDSAIVELLVEKGADPNYLSRSNTNETPLAMALSFGIPRENLSIFHYLIDHGADINREFDDQDIAKVAATLGQMHIVNELLARGYRRDFSELLVTLKIRIVSADAQAENDKAIATVIRALAAPEYRSKIPALLKKLRELIADDREEPGNEDSPHMNPEKDKEVIALENILKS